MIRTADPNFKAYAWYPSTLKRNAYQVHRCTKRTRAWCTPGGLNENLTFKAYAWYPSTLKRNAYQVHRRTKRTRAWCTPGGLNQNSNFKVLAW